MVRILDEFERNIHKNRCLCYIERESEAKHVYHCQVKTIMWLNFKFITILMVRFGNKQEVVDIHYKDWLIFRHLRQRLKV